ncbi:MAG: heme A synthase [Proteobacteria bacterium]|nr:heme A synthase [Pseudomonadota bacterium]
MINKKRVGSKIGIVLGATVLFTYLLMVMGTFVTSTGSGLACPDWPLCYGTVVPPLELSIWFEWSHRLLGGITSALILVSTLVVWRYYKGLPRVFTSLMISLLAVGVLLGGITVLIEAPMLSTFTHIAIISSHLVIATLVLICLLFTLRYVLISKAKGTDSVADTKGYFRLLFGAVYLQVVLGIVVRYSGATLACPDVPLCGGKIIPDMSSYLVALHFTHRVSAVIILLLTAAVLYKAVKAGIDARRFAIALGMVLLQATFGILIVVMQMFLPVIIFHAATGFMLLGFLAYQSAPEFFSFGKEVGRSVDTL